MNILGKINFKIFAEGSKSECYRPYIFIDNGSQILLYRKDDNPFENKGFKEYEGKEVSIEGEFTAGLFIVESIQEIARTEEKVEEME